MCLGNHRHFKYTSVVDMRLTQHIRLHTTTYHLLSLMSQEVRESLHCASGTQGQSPLALTAAQLLREWKQRNCCDKTHGRHVASHVPRCFMYMLMNRGTKASVGIQRGRWVYMSCQGFHSKNRPAYCTCKSFSL